MALVGAGLLDAGLNGITEIIDAAAEAAEGA